MSGVEGKVDRENSAAGVDVSKDRKTMLVQLVVPGENGGKDDDNESIRDVGYIGVTRL